jgi:hypothetical protein
MMRCVALCPVDYTKQITRRRVKPAALRHVAKLHIKSMKFADKYIGKNFNATARQAPKKKQSQRPHALVTQL